MNRLPDNKDDLYAAYCECGDIKGMAVKFSLPKWFIIFELSYYEIAGFSLKSSCFVNSPIPCEDLRQLVRSQKSVKAIADYLHVSEYVVRKALRVCGMLDKVWTRAKPYQWKEEDLKADLEVVSNFNELLEKYKCSRSTLLRILEKFDIKIPAEKRRISRTKYEFDRDQLIKDYEELRSLSAIKNKYGCSLYTIWKAFRDLDIPHDRGY
jgi:hypothetical protein